MHIVVGGGGGAVKTLPLGIFYSKRKEETLMGGAGANGVSPLHSACCVIPSSSVRQVTETRSNITR